MTRFRHWGRAGTLYELLLAFRSFGFELQRHCSPFTSWRTRISVDERLESRATRAEQWLGTIKKEIEDTLIAPMEASRSKPQMLN